MFSFRLSRQEEPGSGVKAARGRRPAPLVSPYSPSDHSQLASPRPAQNPRWLPGIVAGAGRLLSSVFLSESDESTSSYPSDSDGSGVDSSGEDDNGRACSTGFYEVDMTARGADYREKSPITTERNEKRLAIEKFLLQETFSRVEGDRLIKIIESRILDTMEDESMLRQNALSGVTAQIDVTLKGTSGSMKWGRKFPEELAYFANHQHDLSPKMSILHAYSHDLYNEAIMEAKKWLEREKMESSSKADLKCGTCTLNSEDLQYLMDSEAGSPVGDVRSYMRERRPWQSPILSSIQLKTPPIGTHLFGDEAPSSVKPDSFFTSKGLQDRKRRYLADNFDDIKSVRFKSLKNPPYRTALHQVEPSEGPFEHEGQQATDERSIVVASMNYAPISSSVVEASKPIDVSASMPEKLTLEESCHDVLHFDGRPVQVDNLKPLPSSEMTRPVDFSASLDGNQSVEDVHGEVVSFSEDEKPLKNNCLTNYEVNAETGSTNHTCDIVHILHAQDNTNGTNLKPDDSILLSLSPFSNHPDVGQSEAGKYCYFNPESADVLNIKRSQLSLHLLQTQKRGKCEIITPTSMKDVEASPETDKQTKRLPAPDKFATHVTRVNLNHAADTAENVESAQDVRSPRLGIKKNAHIVGTMGPKMKIHFATRLDIDSMLTKMEDGETRQSESAPAFEVMSTPVDMHSADGKDHFGKGAISAIGHTPNSEFPVQPVLALDPYIIYKKKGSHHLPTSRNGHPVALSPPKSCWLSTEVPIDPTVDHSTSGIQEKRQNGATMKSSKKMHSENPPQLRHARGKRVSVRPRRGRGRGQGR